MTLDEAIKHCEEVAEKQEKIAIYTPIEMLNGDDDIEKCQECANEHRQLAEWLKELKDLKEHSASFQKINELAKFAIDATGQSDGYLQGMCNGIEYMRGRLTNTECNFFNSEVTE